MSNLIAELAQEHPGHQPGQRVAVVTGAAGGLGSAIVRRLVQAGCSIVLVDLNGDRAAEVAGEAGASGLSIRADLSRPEAADKIMGLIADHLGRVDYLVNNAAAQRLQTIFELTPTDWDDVMAVNLRAPVFMAKAALPFWEAQQSGAIVNIGSRVWVSGSIPAYTTSKAGVVGLTRSMAVELGRLNVRANAVAPSYVDTPFTRQTRGAEEIAARQRQVLSITPLNRIGTPEDVANAVNFLLSDEASYITGEVIHVCGGSQLAPQTYSFSRE